MSRSITGRLPESADVLVQKLRDSAKKHDVHFEGDNTYGIGKGKGFIIKYHVEGDRCTVTVTKKPFLVPWSVVEGMLAKMFKNANVG